MIEPIDFTISKTVRAAFYCNEDSITVQIKCGSEDAGPPMTFTYEQAVALGNRIMESGFWNEFPVNGTPVEALKSFGSRLRHFGLHGN